MLTFTDGHLTLIPGFVALMPAIPIASGSCGAAPIGAGRCWRCWPWSHITLVVALTIFPIPIAGQDYYRQTRGMSEDNIVPFATIASQLVHLSLSTIRQLFGNIVALAPLGIYGPALVARAARLAPVRPGRGGIRRRHRTDPVRRLADRRLHVPGDGRGRRDHERRRARSRPSSSGPASCASRSRRGARCGRDCRSSLESSRHAARDAGRPRRGGRRLPPLPPARGVARGSGREPAGPLRRRAATGPGRCPAWATRRLGSWSSASRRRPTAAIGPAGSSPAIDRAISCSRRCIGPGSQPADVDLGRRRAEPERRRTSPRSCAARRPTTSHSPTSGPTACRTWCARCGC